MLRADACLLVELIGGAPAWEDVVIERGGRSERAGGKKIR